MPANHRHEHGGKGLCGKAEVTDQEHRRRQHIDEEAGEIEGIGQRQPAEFVMREHLAVSAGQRYRMQRLAFLRGQRLGQPEPAGDQHQDGERREKQKIPCQLKK